MKKTLCLIAMLLSLGIHSFSQNVMTPELLWKLGRVGAECISPDGKSVIYGISYPNVETNKSVRQLYSMPIAGGDPTQLTSSEGNKSEVRMAGGGKIIFSQKGKWMLANADASNAIEISGLPDGASNLRISPDGSMVLFTNDVKLQKISGKDLYNDLPKSNVNVYSSLNAYHWDEWEDGAYSHVFYAPFANSTVGAATDIMKDQLFDCPQKPHGGAEDVIWAPDSKSIIYVTKQKTGTAYAVSTNTDIFQYLISAGTTLNLTLGMEGYDMAPSFSPDGKQLAWLSMAHDGFEADKNDLVILDWATGTKRNVTAQWDESVTGFIWSQEANNQLYFTAYTDGTEQLFSVSYPVVGQRAAGPDIAQLTKGDFDVSGIAGESNNKIVVTHTDMNHAAELFVYNIKDNSLSPLTHVNDKAYMAVSMGKIERKYFTTTDGKKMLVWVMLPPNFDRTKKYPTLLYCQGGPQSALSQFYSFRWNFQLMAANGYVVVAPNRRGMPGHGVKWNQDISGDWGGQSIQDYLTAIDSISKESYVDVTRRAAVGASYGGYSVFMLAGVHANRFKSFIAHDGVFDTRSWYGTTEEMWFANYDMNGPYWLKQSEKSYSQFNPITYADKWNTPIMIYQGGKDYRTPIGQALQAFNNAQLHGIKSRLVYLPDENHWVMQAQNALVWQRQFYEWLSETLK